MCYTLLSRRVTYCVPFAPHVCRVFRLWVCFRSLLRVASSPIRAACLVLLFKNRVFGGYCLKFRKQSGVRLQLAFKFAWSQEHKRQLSIEKIKRLQSRTMVEVSALLDCIVTNILLFEQTYLLFHHVSTVFLYLVMSCGIPNPSFLTSANPRDVSPLYMNRKNRTTHISNPMISRAESISRIYDDLRNVSFKGRIIGLIII